MGKKQSPFIGRRVPLVDNGVPILYPRYSNVEAILVDGASDKKRAAPDSDAAPEAAAAAAAADNGSAAAQPAAKKAKKDKQQAAEAQEQQEAAHGLAQQDAAGSNGQQQEQQQQQQLSKKEKKRLKQQQQQGATEATPPAAAAEDDGTQQEQQQLSKKEKKKLRQQQQQQQAGSKPSEQQQQQESAAAESKGNAEEAARIRQVLGFTAPAGATDSNAQPQPPPAAAAAAAAAAVPKVSGGGAFSFNFSNLSAEDAVAADTEAKLAAIVAVDTADKEGFVPRRVFVGGMPYSYSREQVEEYWGWCGAIEDLDLMTFPDTGRFRGIAFITFTTQEGADAALACDGEQLEGHTLKVERCKAAAVAKQLKASAAAAARNTPQQQSQRGRQQQQQQQAPAAAAAAANGDGPGKTPGYNVAYVGNIAFEARPEDISALFEACNVTKVRLHTDKDTRKSKGYAHVHFADEAGLEQAIAMSGTQLMGRSIKVSYGQPKRT